MSRIFDVSCDGYPAFDVSPIFPFCPPAARTLTLRQHEKPLPPRISTPEAIIGLERGQKTSLCTAPSSRPPERTRRHQTSVQQPAAQDEGGEGRIEEESTPSFDLAFVSRMKSPSGVEGKGRRRTAGHYPNAISRSARFGFAGPIITRHGWIGTFGKSCSAFFFLSGVQSPSGTPVFFDIPFCFLWRRRKEARASWTAGRPCLGG